MAGGMDQDRVVQQVSDHQRKAGMNTRTGYISDIKSGENGELKVRMVIGLDPNGKPVKSPWLWTTHHRGQSTERMAFKKDQTGRMVAPDGDYRQAYFTTGPESEKCPPPDHAKNEAEHYFQNGDLHTTRAEKFHELYVKSTDNIRFSKEDVHVGLIGGEEGCRYQAHKEGAKLKAGKSQYAVITKARPIVSQPWVIDKDPTPDPSRGGS